MRVGLPKLATKVTAAALAAAVIGLGVPGATAEVGPGNPPTTFNYLRSSDGGDDFVPASLNDASPETGSTKVKAFEGSVHSTFVAVSEPGGESEPRQIHYRRSSNGGTSFGSSIRIDDNVGDSDDADLAVDDQAVHVIWADDRLLPNGEIDPCCHKSEEEDGIANPAENNRDEIMYARSDDGGGSFSEGFNITDSPNNHNRDPDIAVEEDLVVVGYEGIVNGPNPEDDLNEDDNVLFKRSVDGGLTWEPEINLTADDSGEQDEPSIALSDDIVHVSFRNKPTGSIGYTRSASGGAAGTFGSFTTFAEPAEDSALLANGDNVHIAVCTKFADDVVNPDHDLLLYTSSDGGETFAPPLTVANLPAECGKPAIAGGGDQMHISFNMDAANVVGDIFHVRSADGGQSWGAPVNRSSNPEASDDSSITVDPADGSSVHMSWTDSSTFLFVLGEDQELPLSDGDLQLFAKGDVIRYVGGAYEMVIDGSDLGLHSFRDRGFPSAPISLTRHIDGLASLPADDPEEGPTQFLMSFTEPGPVPDIRGRVDAADIVLFSADTLGEETSGTFELYLDGSDIGLIATGENIDDIEVEQTDEGVDLYLSTTLGFKAESGGNAVEGRNDDVFVCRGATTGPTSSCAGLELGFDGNAVQVTGIDAFAFNGLGNTGEGAAFFSTEGPFSVATGPGDRSDVLECRFTEEEEAEDENGEPTGVILVPETSLEDCGISEFVPLVKVFDAQTHLILENLIALDTEF